MNKKEISEIKKQFTQDRCAITRICGCYVDGEKEKKAHMKEAFLSLPEEEMFKYFEILRKNLSGNIGKNLFNMEFPLETESYGGTQEFLMRLRASRLKDDVLLEQFYDQIIQTYDYGENYLILLIHAAYDIPGKSTDGAEMFDSSDEVYEYLLCSICPVKLSKPGLYYNTEENCFQDRIRDWIVEMPSLGFLFPAFNDRSTDIHSLLYYSKNANAFSVPLIEEILGCKLPMTAKDQKETFQHLLEETLQDECEFEIVKNIHEALNELIETKKEDPDPLELDKAEVRYILEESGVSTEKMQNFDTHFDTCTGENQKLLASNVTNTRKFEIKSSLIKIQVEPGYADLIETRIIDGRKCFIIPADEQVEINGLSVSTGTASIDPDQEV